MSTVRSHTTNASVHLDAVRGLAALAVFAGHGRALFLRSGFATHGRTGFGGVGDTFYPVEHRTTVGHEAVIVFFVLSGYFVGGSALRSMKQGSFDFGHYLLQRLARLWTVLIPALLLGLVVDRLGMHWLGGPQSLYMGPAASQVISGVASRLSAWCFLGNVFFLQDIYVDTFGTNLALWSLACEFWYYLLFPAVLYVCFAKSRPFARLWSVVLLAGGLCLCGPGVAKYFPLWLIGCVVSLMPLGIPQTQQRRATTLMSGLMIATFVVCLRLRLNLYAADVWICITFAVLLWAIAHNRQTTVNPWYRRAAQSLARMSYTLYAIHFPLLVFGCALLSPVWKPRVLSSGVLLQIAPIFAVVFLIAAGMYMLFERNTERFRRWVSQALWRWRTAPNPAAAVGD